MPTIRRPPEMRSTVNASFARRAGGFPPPGRRPGDAEPDPRGHRAQSGEAGPRLDPGLVVVPGAVRPIRQPGVVETPLLGPGPVAGEVRPRAPGHRDAPERH